MEEKMANIITGIRIAVSLVLLFCPVFSLTFIDLRYSAPVVCVIATAAAIDEGCLVRRQL